jgi:hypothetical protein
MMAKYASGISTPDYVKIENSPAEILLWQSHDPMPSEGGIAVVGYHTGDIVVFKDDKAVCFVRWLREFSRRRLQRVSTLYAKTAAVYQNRHVTGTVKIKEREIRISPTQILMIHTSYCPETKCWVLRTKEYVSHITRFDMDMARVENR